VSLINDALKNARKHQRDSTAKGPPLTPVLPGEPDRHWQWPLGIVVVFLLLSACIVIIFALRLRPAPSPAKIASAQIPAQPVAVAPVTAPPPLPVPAANMVTAAPAAPVLAPAPVPAKPVVPKLQGIFYDPAHPTAIVSGKTVHLGDVINGLRVKSISATTLVLVGPDRKETSLTMTQ
jgi:hypothetical protein